MVTYQASWRKAGNAQGPGAQIDLLIDRSDQCINVCEIKFSEQLFTIDKSYAEALQRKLLAFRTATKTRKTTFLTMITTYGIKENDHKTQSVDSQLTMDDIFRYYGSAWWARMSLCPIAS